MSFRCDILEGSCEILRHHIYIFLFSGTSKQGGGGFTKLHILLVAKSNVTPSDDLHELVLLLVTGVRVLMVDSL